MEARVDWPSFSNITPSQATEVFHILDQKDPVLGVTDPDDPRLPFRNADTPLLVEHPGGGFGRFICHTRYLATSEMSIISKVFIHDGSKVRVYLPTRWGAEEEQEGIVKKCAYVRHSIHEVLIKFRSQVSLRHFLDVPAHFTVDAETGINPATLSGRILIFDDSEPDVRLIQHFLRRTKMQLKEATSLGNALDLIRSEPFDLILCGEMVNMMPSDRIIASLRDAGSTSPLVVMGSTVIRDATEEPVRSSPSILEKPLDYSEVLRVVAEVVGCVDGTVTEEYVYSTLPDDSENVALVNWYIDHVKRIVHGMQKASIADSTEDARRYATTLRDTGTSYGFPLLSESAGKLLTAINASGSILESSTSLQQLVNLTRRMRGIA